MLTQTSVSFLHRQLQELIFPISLTYSLRSSLLQLGKFMLISKIARWNHEIFHINFEQKVVTYQMI